MEGLFAVFIFKKRNGEQKEMKTNEILNIDCRRPGGKEKLNSFLWKIKPVTKLGLPKGCILLIDDVEKVLHGISLRYSYKVAQISPYYEGGKFVFFKGEVMKRDENMNIWCGTVYGQSMWELMTKSIIKIYGEIKKERSGQ